MATGTTATGYGLATAGNIWNTFKVIITHRGAYDETAYVTYGDVTGVCPGIMGNSLTVTPHNTPHPEHYAANEFVQFRDIYKKYYYYFTMKGDTGATLTGCSVVLSNSAGNKITLTSDKNGEIAYSSVTYYDKLSVTGYPDYDDLEMDIAPGTLDDTSTTTTATANTGTYNTYQTITLKLSYFTYRFSFWFNRETDAKIELTGGNRSINWNDTTPIIIAINYTWIDATAATTVIHADGDDMGTFEWADNTHTAIRFTPKAQTIHDNPAREVKLHLTGKDVDPVLNPDVKSNTITITQGVSPADGCLVLTPSEPIEINHDSTAQIFYDVTYKDTNPDTATIVTSGDNNLGSVQWVDDSHTKIVVTPNVQEHGTNSRTLNISVTAKDSNWGEKRSTSSVTITQKGAPADGYITITPTTEQSIASGSTSDVTWTVSYSNITISSVTISTGGTNYGTYDWKDSATKTELIFTPTKQTVAGNPARSRDFTILGNDENYETSKSSDTVRVTQAAAASAGNIVLSTTQIFPIGNDKSGTFTIAVTSNSVKDIELITSGSDFSSELNADKTSITITYTKNEPGAPRREMVIKTKGTDSIFGGEILSNEIVISQDAGATIYYYYGTIQGNGSALADATVTINGNDYTTDQDGHFGFSSTTNTSYTVTASKTVQASPELKINLEHEEVENTSGTMSISFESTGITGDISLIENEDWVSINPTVVSHTGSSTITYDANPTGEDERSCKVTVTDITTVNYASKSDTIYASISQTYDDFILNLDFAKIDDVDVSFKQKKGPEEEKTTYYWNATFADGDYTSLTWYLRSGVETTSDVIASGTGKTVEYSAEFTSSEAPETYFLHWSPMPNSAAYPSATATPNTQTVNADTTIGSSITVSPQPGTTITSISTDADWVMWDDDNQCLIYRGNGTGEDRTTTLQAAVEGETYFINEYQAINPSVSSAATEIEIQSFNNVDEIDVATITQKGGKITITPEVTRIEGGGNTVRTIILANNSEITQHSVPQTSMDTTMVTYHGDNYLDAPVEIYNTTFIVPHGGGGIDLSNLSFLNIEMAGTLPDMYMAPELSEGSATAYFEFWFMIYILDSEGKKHNLKSGATTCDTWDEQNAWLFKDYNYKIGGSGPYMDTASDFLGEHITGFTHDLIELPEGESEIYVEVDVSADLIGGVYWSTTGNSFARYTLKLGGSIDMLTEEGGSQIKDLAVTFDGITNTDDASVVVLERTGTATGWTVTFDRTTTPDYISVHIPDANTEGKLNVMVQCNNVKSNEAVVIREKASPSGRTYNYRVIDASLKQLGNSGYMDGVYYNYANGTATGYTKEGGLISFTLPKDAPYGNLHIEDRLGYKNNAYYEEPELEITTIDNPGEVYVCVPRFKNFKIYNTTVWDFDIQFLNANKTVISGWYSVNKEETTTISWPQTDTLPLFNSGFDRNNKIEQTMNIYCNIRTKEGYVQNILCMVTYNFSSPLDHIISFVGMPNQIVKFNNPTNTPNLLKSSNSFYGESFSTIHGNVSAHDALPILSGYEEIELWFAGFTYGHLDD